MSDGIDGVGPAGWADQGAESILQVDVQVMASRDLRIVFFIFEGPSLFSDIDLAQVFDAGIRRAELMCLGKTGKDDRSEHRKHHNAQVSGD